MVQASYIPHTLKFYHPAGTSRGVLNNKACWYVRLVNEAGVAGLGEVSFIPGLSVEDPDEIEIQLDHICKLITRGEMDPDQVLPALPGIRFAVETALLDMARGGNQLLYPSDFTRGLDGIPINGLIWMGDRSHMQKQVREKIAKGFRILKIKVGAIALEDELEMLFQIRSEFEPGDLEIRLDANGAWTPEEAPGRLSALARFGIHSIEQPLMPGQPAVMARLCENADIPVALDEELIGVSREGDRRSMLESIKPSYIILKPGLLGGFGIAREWVLLADELGIGWWITSALESNLGLNAIAQWTYDLGVTIPQGLGTGQIYSNNIPSPLQLEGDRLWYREGSPWELQSIMNS